MQSQTTTHSTMSQPEAHDQHDRSMQLTLYHVTPVEHATAILLNGLKSDSDGDIYLFSEVPISPWHFHGHPVVIPHNHPWDRPAELIALDQLTLHSGYAVLSIRPEGIEGSLTEDRVGERTAPYHRILRQRHIAPRFLELTSVAVWSDDLALPRQMRLAIERAVSVFRKARRDT